MPLRRALVALFVLVPGPRRCTVQAASVGRGPPRAAEADGFERRQGVKRWDHPESPDGGVLLAVGRGPPRAAEADESERRQGVKRWDHLESPDSGMLQRLGRGPPEAADEVKKHQGVKTWGHLESPDGGSDKSTKWREEKGGGTVPWLTALLFIVLIGSMPIIGANAAGGLTKTHVIESAFLYTWLLGGLYLFTNVLIFQSPHFEQPRTLCLEESVYLYAQILTTVGYGDITPARPRGQLCVGLFVLTAVLLISGMVQDILAIFRTMMEGRMGDQALTPRSERSSIRKAFEPVIYSSLVFCCFAAGGATFFTFYPGEEKTLAQGVYMSLITLSTVGFGAFTPSTHAGMVAGAYWMLFGCTSLMAVITSRAAFAMTLKAHEIKLMQEKSGGGVHKHWNDLKEVPRGRSPEHRFTRTNTHSAAAELYLHGAAPTTPERRGSRGSVDHAYHVSPR